MEKFDDELEARLFDNFQFVRSLQLSIGWKMFGMQLHGSTTELQRSWFKDTCWRLLVQSIMIVSGR
jgi:hypothetical protein